MGWSYISQQQSNTTTGLEIPQNLDELNVSKKVKDKVPFFSDLFCATNNSQMLI